MNREDPLHNTFQLKCEHYKTKTIAKAEREQELICEDKFIVMTSDLSAETIKVKTEWNDRFQAMRVKKMSTKIMSRKFTSQN